MLQTNTFNGIGEVAWSRYWLFENAAFKKYQYSVLKYEKLNINYFSTSFSHWFIKECTMKILTVKMYILDTIKQL